ncbi:hypothetical protein O0I10_013273 [Lichtheimia ornata]|uniref:Uncharacterized protein n=1 Tax=Lichtheimia ornata TaxID=688661 RepID=A0AAD7UPL1_9FUNG|nr:uncharacterized protein O0I10_013273 [Lichtheimia ornata]KAJ8651249.1 hypothetical protein O0I10_013273 [Lichtheimia ornata]
MRRNYAWSNAGDPAHVHVPILRAPSTTLLAAVSNVGLIEVAMNVCPKNDGEKGTKKPVKKGTTSIDFLGFVNLVMDQLDARG